MRVIDAGPLSTIQDFGRFGFRAIGVPQSGAVDRQALRIGNLLVGNDENAAAVECTLGGFSVEFLSHKWFAVTGRSPDCFLNSERVQGWTGVAAHTGDVLSLSYAGPGSRYYVCVSGGIEVPVVLGSRSTCLKGGFGGLQGRALGRGDLLPVGSIRGPIRTSPSYLVPEYSAEPEIRVVPGPQNEGLTPGSCRVMLSSRFEVTTRSDRMGVELYGPALEHSAGPDIITDGTVPGSIQVPGTGRPIVLLADCQTTGGYVKPFTVISCDLPLIAQLRPGEGLRFRSIGLEDAREAYLRGEYLARSFSEWTGAGQS